MPRKPYQLDVNSNMPVTSIQRFTNLENETALLITQNFDTATVLTYRGPDEPELQNDVNLHDLGNLEDEAQKKKMQHMLQKKDDGEMGPYNFEGMKICNSAVALNSHFFCVGLVGEFKPEEDKRRNDKRSVLGIFRYDHVSRQSSIENWVN